MYKKHKIYIIFILCCCVEGVKAVSLHLNEGSQREMCASIFSESLKKNSKDMHTAIETVGGEYEFATWKPLRGSNQINSYTLEYSKFDLDNNGELDIVVKGFIGCGGYRPFYRVIESKHLAAENKTGLSIGDIWSSDGVGWCFGSQYPHYGVPYSYDLRSFEYKEELYLTLESFNFGIKGYEGNSFIVAKYTGVMDIPKGRQEGPSVTDKLELICRFSYQKNGIASQEGGTP